MTSGTMVEAGPGTARTRARRRKFIRVMALSALVGGVLGGTLAILQPGGEPGFITGDFSGIELSPVAAILLAVGFAAALIGLPLWTALRCDEHELLLNLKAAALSCTAMLGLYPSWELLAAGGLVPAPSAAALFALGFAMLMITYGFMKVRSR